jgi:hypothetical protein
MAAPTWHFVWKTLADPIDCASTPTILKYWGDIRHRSSMLVSWTRTGANLEDILFAEYETVLLTLIERIISSALCG